MRGATDPPVHGVPIPVPESADGAPSSELAITLAALAGDDSDVSQQASARRAATLLAKRARSAGAKALASGQFLADVLSDVAPHVRVRDLETLQAHHGGQTGEALADTLERNATKATTSLGAAVGTAAAAQWFAGPTLLMVPVEIMIETLAVALVEVKLIAELHAVYDVPVVGSGTDRGMAFLQAWASGRGVDPWRPWVASAAMGAATRSSVARRAMGRMGRGIGGVVPLMVGAVWGARANRNQTRRLAAGIRADLRTTRLRLGR